MFHCEMKWNRKPVVAMSSPLSQLLKQSRARLGISQMEMSLRLGVSQRHVSFIESARSQPSRALLLAWMRELRADDSLLNAALLHAGYARGGVDPDPGSPALAQAFAALRQMLAAHEPNAGLIFDADWNAVEINGSGRWLCSILMPELWECRPDGPLDMIATIEHPGGLLSRAVDPASAGEALLSQLRAEQWARPALQPRVDQLAAALRRRYPAHDVLSARRTLLPHLELEFDTSLGRLSFLLMQSVFGLAHDVTVGSLRTELWFPADASTAEVMRTRNYPRGN